MILAATAIPIEFRPPQQPELLPLSIDIYDILANIAGFVPVGIVLAALGPSRAVMAAALLSLFAEATQAVMVNRLASLTDVVTNVVGAILGVVLVARFNIKPQFRATRWIGAVAAVLCLLLILGVWKMSAERAKTTSGTATLEAHWTFDESNGRVAVDSSGHGLNGEYNNEPKKVAGPMGNAVKFDGTDYINFGSPTALRLTSSVTISAWIKSTYFPRDDAVIVSNRFRGVGFQLDTTVDKGPRTIGFKLTNSCGTSMARYGATALALDKWYYVTGVYNAKAKTMDVYLNGELDNGVLVGPVMGIQKISRKNVFIGRRSDTDRFTGRRSDSDRFTGDIDDVRIYSLPLTKTEIVADMHDGSAHATALQYITRGDDGPRPLEYANETCSWSADPDDEKIPAVAVVLGVLAAIGCTGLFPSSGSRSCLIASLVAGLLFVSATASALPMLTRWMMLLLSLVGGASVGFTIRDQDGMSHQTEKKMA
jgi:ABC-type nickel/cobalt efflux system permease component RcnA